jgi:hypothetical protein
MMRRRAIEQTANVIQSRKLAQAIGMGAREMRAGWTAADKRFGMGRYRWYRKGLRAELMRLRMNETPWPWGLTA